SQKIARDCLATRGGFIPRPDDRSGSRDFVLEPCRGGRVMTKRNLPPMQSRSLMSRRTVLRGFGGVTLALPFLEGLAPKNARAQDGAVPPYAIFFRQGNGVATEQSGPLGDEPERFWPHNV